MTSEDRRYVLLTVCVLGIAAVACGSGATGVSPTPADAPGRALARFHTAVAKDVDRQFEIYWLGERFTAGGVEYFGPNVPDFGAVNDSGRLDLDYAPTVRGGGGLGIALLSSEQSKLDIELVLGPDPADPVAVQFGSYAGQLYRTGLAGDILVVIAPVGDQTVLVASAERVALAAGATPPPSPLADEAVLMDVLADLRPYPE